MAVSAPSPYSFDWQKAILPVPPVILADTPLRIAIAHMNQSQSGCALVRDNTELVGIVTDQIVLGAIAGKVNLETVPVSGIMRPVTVLSIDEIQNILFVLSQLQRDDAGYLPIVDGYGDVTGLITAESVCRSLLIDVTKQQQTEILLEQRLTAIETSIDGIAILDHKGCYTYVNQAHLTLFGFDKAEELIGKTWHEIYNSDEILRFEQEVFPIFQQKGNWRGESMGKKRDGSPVPQEVALTRLADGGLTCICRNITGRKRYEEELLRSRAELESQIQERTEELSNVNAYLKAEIVKCEKLAKELAASETALRKSEAQILQALEYERELNELKSRFVTNTSHEFRTPLTTILGSAELLELAGDRWTIEKRAKHFQRIRLAVQYITDLLDDLLTIGKLEAGQFSFNPQPVDVVAFCHDLVTKIQTTIASHHDVRFTCEIESALVRLDENLLKQILENLLLNAIRYSSDGSRVFLALSFSADCLTFSIHDQGIGIPENDLPRVFDPFHRAVNVGTISGNGLGLTIVKRAVDLHSGQIMIESTVNTGTICTVRLPLNDADNQNHIHNLTASTL